MQDERFDQVWYRDAPGRWSELLAMQDSGVLEIHDSLIEFRGTRHCVTVQNVTALSIKRMGLVNKWIRIEYSDGDQRRTAYFADGSGLGWGGVLGGTEKLHGAIQRAVTIGRLQAARARSGNAAEPKAEQT